MLTPYEKQVSDAFLLPLFYNAGLVSAPNNINKYYWDDYIDKHKSELNNIYNMLLNRKISEKISSDISRNYYQWLRWDGLRKLDDFSTYFQGKKAAEAFPKIFAQFCADNDLYWDDLLLTPYERNELITRYKIPKALAEYNLFLSQQDLAKKDQPKPAKVATKAPSQTNATSAVAGQPKNPYKSLGPLSARMPNIVNANKIHPSASIMYCIEADPQGKNIPRIFITPIDSTGKANLRNKAETVNLGSGNGYSDCTLYWDSLPDVQAAFNILMGSQLASATKFSNLHIAKVKKIDPNGYFKVSTQIGDAYIKASKMNEELIKDIEVFEEAYFDNLDY